MRDLLENKIANPFHQDPAAATAQVRIGDPENPEPMTIRSLIHFLRRRAFQSPYKVAVVADGHRLNTAAANAFLKTLEEPPPDTVIFLLTTGTEGMLPTILSRCQKIRFEPWTEEELDRPAEGYRRSGRGYRPLPPPGPPRATPAGVWPCWATEARIMCSTGPASLFEGIHRRRPGPGGHRRR